MIRVSTSGENTVSTVSIVSAARSNESRGILAGSENKHHRADDADGADANPAFCFGESALASIILRRMAAASAISQSLEFSDVSSSSTARDCERKARADVGRMKAKARASKHAPTHSADDVNELNLDI
jgi:hypothetical protein